MCFSSSFCMENDKQSINDEQIVAEAVQAFIASNAANVAGFMSALGNDPGINDQQRSAPTEPSSSKDANIIAQQESQQATEKNGPCSTVIKLTKKEQSYNKDKRELSSSKYRFLCCNRSFLGHKELFDHMDKSPDCFNTIKCPCCYTTIKNKDSRKFIVHIIQEVSKRKSQVSVENNLSCLKKLYPCDYVKSIRYGSQTTGPITVAAVCGKSLGRIPSIFEHLKECESCKKRIDCPFCLSYLDLNLCRYFSIHFRKKREIEIVSDEEIFPCRHLKAEKQENGTYLYSLTGKCDMIVTGNAEAIRKHFEEQCKTCHEKISCKACIKHLSDTSKFAKHLRITLASIKVANGAREEQEQQTLKVTHAKRVHEESELEAKRVEHAYV